MVLSTFDKTTRLAIILAVVAAVSWMYASLGVHTPSTAATEAARPSVLRIPEDVDWFIPDQDGWLCDYKYIKRDDGSLALKILPRTTGLGQIKVYPKEVTFRRERRPRPLDVDGRRYGHVNNFYSALLSTRNSQQLLVDGEWTVVAMNEWGHLDRMFAVTARFGESKAFVGMFSSFTMGQEIPLKEWRVGDYQLTMGQQSFPGIPGFDEVLHAYS